MFVNKKGDIGKTIAVLILTLIFIIFGMIFIVRHILNSLLR